jgi:CIC family chloride channel protein
LHDFFFMKSDRIGLLRKRYFGVRTSLILTSILIGLLTALCAVFLKNGVRLIRHWAQYLSIGQDMHFLLFVFPTAGILLTVWYTQVFLKGKLGRGVTNIIYTISRKSSVVEKDKLYSQMLSSILTVGFGGSAGLEAPIASTGSAIGSNMAGWLRFTNKERTLLLACGAAAGISAIFNAPIAGVIFAFELLLVDMPMPAIVPLLIASASSSVLSHVIYSGQPFVLITDSWSTEHLLYFIAFGFLAAFVSVYSIRVYFSIGDLFARRKSPYLAAAAGGLALGALIFFFPALYGEGYEIVTDLLHRNPGQLLADSLFVPAAGAWTLVIWAVVLMLLKVVATAMTVGAGGNGGMFGSSLFTGAMCGYAFSHSINLLGIAQLDEVNFTVIGMAALMSGVIHAPLTGIFLIAEITGGYALFLPLMIVSSISYLVTKYYEPYSVYTKKLAMKGDLIQANKDKTVLSKMKLSSYLETDFIAVSRNGTLTQLIPAIEKSRRNIFPVTDDEGRLVGEILLDNIRHLMFSEKSPEKIRISDLMIPPPAVIEIGEDMEQVLKKFDDTGSWNLPVTGNGRYLGFVSKSKLFTQYRNYLLTEAKLPA